MNDTPTDPARLTAVVDYHTVGSLLREVLFPPMTVGIFLTRAGSGLLGLAAWMVTALAIAMVLMRFDVARTTAGMVGVVTPVIVVIVLNSLGVFNRRGAGAKPLRQSSLSDSFMNGFLPSPAGGWASRPPTSLQRMSMLTRHCSCRSATPGCSNRQTSGCAICRSGAICGTGASSAERAQAPCASYCMMRRIVLHDANGQTVGGTGPQGGDEVWLAY